ncbi:structure-specific endonuclease subunit SLX1 [Varanus komodoensis]|uniref:GIY-YIG domain-containing protein n=1 Tax=Varanus komodoensis TaxID=61221 RepID=A0A8D2KUQ7_VARKO|nr:structure-specific endonuclease subunit SLX1 [Varanus komodoensis]XP_044303753.1 structure-specific endonuclease subunit SLX1 [Varanus komodoensis]XP_044303755.1 structure-specific endonuclease subunit SLX1 [Varanus komodoensis]XP_044303756.1 structure-specific endonuclease subunit SLX1 [Varanus komodoensis]
MVVEVRGFFGVYLLYCTNPRYQGRVYVGFTVNPERRIDQHNAGKRHGGAWKTSGRGPWEMVLIVHGFPSDVAALRFEWAWQHPHSSRRLTHVTRRTSRERQFDFHLRVLAHMLRAAPWCRLPLTIRWLKQEYCRDFPAGLEPPLHMPVAFGQVRAVKEAKGVKPALSEKQVATSQHCCICLKTFQDGDDDTPLHCFHPGCAMAAHIICLSQVFLEKEPHQLLPIEGQCPGCKNIVLWGDLIRHHKGCYGNLEPVLTSSQEHWANELQQ